MALVFGELALDPCHGPVAKFHNEKRELTGFMLDRWDLHGVPCPCDLCSHDYRELEIMQREQAQRLLREAS